MEKNTIQVILKKHALDGHYKEAIEEYILSGGDIRDLVDVMTEEANQLYRESQYQRSIEIFTALAAFIEPARVVSYFIEPHMSTYLIDYLIELLKVNEDVKEKTELLFMLFRISNSLKRLDDFIEILQKSKQTGQKLYLDIETATKISIENGFNQQAFEIAQILDAPMQKIELFIHYKGDYAAAADLIRGMSDFNTKVSALLAFGPILIGSDDNIAKKILYVAIEVWREQHRSNNQQIQGNQILNLFYSKPKLCYEFMTKVPAETLQTDLCNALISMLIPRSQKHGDFYGLPTIANAELARKYLENPVMRYDPNCLLQVCIDASFTPGVVIILQRMERFHDIVVYLMENQEYILLKDWILVQNKVLDEDWVDILTFYVKPDGWATIISASDGSKLFSLVLNRAKSQVPFAYIVYILSSNPLLPINVIIDDLKSEYSNLWRKYNEMDNECRSIMAQIEEIDTKINKLEEEKVTFSPNTCNECSRPLQTEFVAFMCGHIYDTSCVKRDQNGHMYCKECGTSYEAEKDTSEDVFNPLANCSDLDLLQTISNLIVEGVILNP